MSMEYCHRHDNTYNTDYDTYCHMCEREEGFEDTLTFIELSTILMKRHPTEEIMDVWYASDDAKKKRIISMLEIAVNAPDYGKWPGVLLGWKNGSS